MKLVNIINFLRMPQGTVFQKFEPQYTEHLSILMGGECDKDGLGDFVYEDLDALGVIKIQSLIEVSHQHSEILNKSLHNGVSFEVEFGKGSRDGCFEPEQLFIVWEKEDVKKLIERLQRTL